MRVFPEGLAKILTHSFDKSVLENIILLAGLIARNRYWINQESISIVGRTGYSNDVLAAL